MVSESNRSLPADFAEDVLGDVHQADVGGFLLEDDAADLHYGAEAAPGGDPPDRVQDPLVGPADEEMVLRLVV